MKIFFKKIVSNLGYKISKISKSSLQNDNPLAAIKESIRDQNEIVLFDVGANLGQTIKKMRFEFPFSKIYAFEPSRSCYKTLISNINLKNIFIYNNAVGSENSKIKFNEYSWSDLSSILKRAFGSAQIIDTYDVDLISIDSFCKINNISKIDFLKTDTEGYELEVLTGASEMMDKNQIQFVYTEVFFKENFIGQASFGDIYNFLLSKNFELVKMYDFEIATDGLANRSDALFINKLFKMKTITIIPARGGSKRLPQKNLKLLGGIPLIAHSILYAQKNSGIIDEIYVSTDNAQIKKIALQFGAKVIDRPELLSGDLEPTVSAQKNVLEQIGDTVENVILLQPTNPLRPENLLKEAFGVFIEENCDSLFTVSRSEQKLGKMNNNQFTPFNYKIGQRSQDLEPLFYENGLLYITKACLIYKDIIISEKAYPFEVNHIFANVDIDTQDDLDYAEYLLKNKKMSYKNLAVQNYKRFCAMEGSEYIASEFALETILKLIKLFDVKEILELGLGIGSISDTVLKYSSKESLKINYVGTEQNEFCLDALKKNVLDYNHIELYNELNQIKNKKFDLIIIDGYDDTLKEVVAFCKKRAIIFIEGDRKGQTETIRQIFPKNKYVNVVTLNKNKPYSHGGGNTNFYVGGGKLIFIDPTFIMKMFWFQQKTVSFIKNKIRTYKLK